MTALVPGHEIEAKVGVRRHSTSHFGRAVTAEQQVYILHAAECLTWGRDLRRCAFSIALDAGIRSEQWDGYEDMAVLLAIGKDGRLVPADGEHGADPLDRIGQGDDPLWSDLFEEVWHSVSYKPGFRLLLKPDEDGGRWYFQVEAERRDTYTGEPGIGRGGKAYLSPHMTRSELAQTAFGLFNAYEHHECREAFKYDGRRVYGPHFDVEALYEIADRTEHRGDPS